MPAVDYTLPPGDRQRHVVRSYDGKVIGHIEGRTFFKIVRASRHQLRRPPAWAIDTAAVEECLRAGVERIQITDLESGDVFAVSMARFCQKSRRFERGFGTQCFLPLCEWKLVRPNDGRQLALPLATLSSSRDLARDATMTKEGAEDGR